MRKLSEYDYSTYLRLLQYQKSKKMNKTAKKYPLPFLFCQIFRLPISTKLNIAQHTVTSAVIIIAGVTDEMLRAPVQRSILAVRVDGRYFFTESAMPITDIAKTTPPVHIIT
jgi:hypothetical protein